MVDPEIVLSHHAPDFGIKSLQTLTYSSFEEGELLEFRIRFFEQHIFDKLSQGEVDLQLRFHEDFRHF